MNKHANMFALAKTVAESSKDPSSKVGTVIVDEKYRVVTTGYNGFVAGCDESKLSYQRPAKYLHIIHSEVNAILFAKRSLDNCMAFITHAPCVHCLKLLIQSGVKQINYLETELCSRFTKEEKQAIIDILLACDYSDKVVSGSGVRYIDFLTRTEYV